MVRLPSVGRNGGITHVLDGERRVWHGSGSP
jgi:hypothetical protein